MKNLLLLFTLAFISTYSFAQSPQKISYQAVIRNLSNSLVTNQNVSMKISVLQGTVSGTAVFVETHNTTTNANGLISIEIGAGIVVSGTVNAIDWSAGPYFIKTETDPAGGNAYNITGVSQLLSVPYALHSNTSDSTLSETDPVFSISVASGITSSDTMNWNNKDDSELNEIQYLSYSSDNDTLFLSQGNFVIVPGLSAANVGNVCPAKISDSRDAEVYNTIKIGNQCWMAENLRYNSAGSVLNTSNPSVIYGRLYDWATLMSGSASSSSNPSGVQGLCPNGWHLPSDSEWNELEMELGMSAADTNITAYRGEHGTYKMKSVIDWSSGGNGANSSDFNVFPTGYHFFTNFFELNEFAYFWSSTETSGTIAWSRYINNVNTGVNRNGLNKSFGYACRCVKD